MVWYSTGLTSTVFITTSGDFMRNQQVSEAKFQRIDGGAPEPPEGAYSGNVQRRGQLEEGLAAPQSPPPHAIREFVGPYLGLESRP
jgi:hypothetical protein